MEQLDKNEQTKTALQKLCHALRTQITLTKEEGELKVLTSCRNGNSIPHEGTCAVAQGVEQGTVDLKDQGSNPAHSKTSEMFRAVLVVKGVGVAFS